MPPEITGGKRAYIQVPGIDVPSTRRAACRSRRVPPLADRIIMPRDADPAVLVGRYILNLVPRLFTLTATSSRRSGDLSC